MSTLQHTPNLSQDELRHEIKKEYGTVALDPDKGSHFHTGRTALSRLNYDERPYEGLPEDNIASFSGGGFQVASGRLATSAGNPRHGLRFPRE